MAQIFSPRANTFLVLTIVCSTLGALLFIFSAPVIQSNQYLTQVKIVREQPVPFSHEHHAGDLAIDCRYCHQSVEKSSFAGMPAASVCMHCHSQMWTMAPMLDPVRQAYSESLPLSWSKVHKLPDYVFFNHSIHVSKGIGCATCHGNVEKMPLMFKEESLQMSWCLNCHRNPERFVQPKSEVFNMNWVRPNDHDEMGNRLVREYHIEKRTDCYTCHR